MTVVNILIAAVALGLMGLLFGLLLMGTEKVFAIPADEKRDAVRAALPGANCGACGYPGCDGCADAIACGMPARLAASPLRTRFPRLWVMRKRQTPFARSPA